MNDNVKTLISTTCITFFVSLLVGADLTWPFFTYTLHVFFTCWRGCHCTNSIWGNNVYAPTNWIAAVWLACACEELLASIVTYANGLRKLGFGWLVIYISGDLHVDYATPPKNVNELKLESLCRLRQTTKQLGFSRHYYCGVSNYKRLFLRGTVSISFQPSVVFISGKIYQFRSPKTPLPWSIAMQWRLHYLNGFIR